MYKFFYMWRHRDSGFPKRGEWVSESEGERERKRKKYIEHLYVVNLNRKCVNKESEVSVTEWWQKNSTITGIVAEKKNIQALNAAEASTGG